MEDQTINAEDCHKILRKRLKTENFELIEFETLNFHNPLQGLVGEHFTVRIEYKVDGETKTENFFMKTLSRNIFLNNFSKDLLLYEKEKYYYNLLEEYEKYNIDTSFAPKGFFFESDVVILEDLSGNFRGTPKFTFLDLEHCKSALDVVAKFHASSIIYETRKSEELNKKFSLFEDNPSILGDNSKGEEDSFTQLSMSSIRGLLPLIDLLPEGPVGSEEFKNTLYALLAEDTTIGGLVNGILHADLWTSNFMHFYEDGKPKWAKLIDFQRVKYGSLEEDVVCFLYTNTGRAFREVHYTSLVEFYYKKLEEYVSCVEYSLPNFKEFLESCENFKVSARIASLVDHSFTFHPDEVYGEVFQTEESIRRFLFDDREKYILQSYNNNEVYKNVLVEDLIDLRALLFP